MRKRVTGKIQRGPQAGARGPVGAGPGAAPPRRTRAPTPARPPSAEALRELNEQLLTVPDDFTPHPKLYAQLRAPAEDDRRAAGSTGARPRRWPSPRCSSRATPIRLTGQDSERGTFAHRHLVLHDVENGDRYCPMQHLPGRRPRSRCSTRRSPRTPAVLHFPRNAPCRSGSPRPRRSTAPPRPDRSRPGQDAGDALGVLVVLRSGTGQRAATSAASKPSTSVGGRSSPMSTSSTAPAVAQRVHGFEAAERDGQHRVHGGPLAAPVCTSTPLGMSTATTGMPRRRRRRRPRPRRAAAGRSPRSRRRRRSPDPLRPGRFAPPGRRHRNAASTFGACVPG